MAETAAPEDAAPAPAPAMDDSKSRVAASSEEHEMKSMLNTLKMGAQAQFEYALMDEIVKLQEALELNAQKTSIDKAEIQATKDKAQAKKQAAGDHAARMAEMEAALQSAQQEEIKKIAQRRADAEKRLADRDKESKRVAQLEARKKEEQRLLAVRPPPACAGPTPRGRPCPSDARARTHLLDAAPSPVPTRHRAPRPRDAARLSPPGGDAQGDDAEGDGGAAQGRRGEAQARRGQGAGAARAPRPREAADSGAQREEGSGCGG